MPPMKEHMREFSMFFQIVLSILGAIALFMMNSISGKMDNYVVEQQKLAITVTEFVATATVNINTIRRNQELFDRIQRDRTSTVDRAKQHFNMLDSKRLP